MPHIRPHRQFDAVEHEGLLADLGRGAGRGRRQNRVAPLEQFEHALAIPAAEILRLHDRCRRHHGAGDQPVAHGGVEIARLRAQAFEMQRGAFGGGDDIGRGAGAGGFGNFDFVARAGRFGDTLERGERLGERALS